MLSDFNPPVVRTCKGLRMVSVNGETGMTYTFEMARAGSSEMEIFGFEPAGEGLYPSLVLVQHIPVGHTGIENDE
jgi:hypothetical protein